MNKSAAYYRLKAIAEFAATTRAMRKIARYKLAKRAYLNKFAAPAKVEEKKETTKHELAFTSNQAKSFDPMASEKVRDNTFTPMPKMKVNPDFLEGERPKGGLIPQTGPAISPAVLGYGEGQTADITRAGMHTNRYKEYDFNKPQILQIEVPITGGWTPAVHTQTTAFLPQAMWEKLPDSEKIKWRSSPYERDGKKARVFFRTYSTSVGEPGQSQGDSREADYFVGNILLSGKDAPTRSILAYTKDTPAPVTRYFIDDKTGQVTPRADVGPNKGYRNGLMDAEYFDGINGLAPINMAVLETYDDRVDPETNIPVPIYQTINDAMNAGVDIAEMAALNNGYFLPTNNCHYGTIIANAWNPYLKPGTFSSGKFAGFRADTNDSPDTLYSRRIDPLIRTFQPFHVEQREPTEGETTAKRLERLKEIKARGLKNKKDVWDAVINGVQFGGQFPWY